MRHLKAGNRLGVTTSHRRAMMRNMVTSILEHGQVTCTLARAKEVRKPLEKMISWGKQGDLHARRQALRFVKSKEAMSQLFEELAERYKDRQGGYSRIIKLGKNRLGDNSEMAIIQLLGSENDQLSELKSQSGKKKKSQKKDSTVLKGVSEEVQAEVAVSENAETDPDLNASAEKSETDEVKAETAAVETEAETKDESPAETSSANSDAEETPETAVAPVEPEVETKEAAPEAAVAPVEPEVETKEAAPEEAAPVQENSEVVSEKEVADETDAEKKTAD